MATILRVAKDCTGKGIEVWTAERPDAPIYFADLEDTKEIDAKTVDSVLAAWAEVHAEELKIAHVDAILQEELRARIITAGDLSVKSDAEILIAVFTSTGIPK